VDNAKLTEEKDMPAGTNSNIGVATTCSIVVTKNADLSYNVTSSDGTGAGKGWAYMIGSQDWVDDFSGSKTAVLGEIMRQIKAI
jgi:hypothetical protein